MLSRGVRAVNFSLHAQDHGLNPDRPRVRAGGSVKAIAIMASLALVSAAASQTESTQRKPFDYVDAKAKESTLKDLFSRVRRGEEIAFNEHVRRGATIVVETSGVEPHSKAELLTSSKIRDWIVSCIRADETGMNLWQDAYQVHVIFQCSTSKLSGDFRGIFTFKNNLLTHILVQRMNEKPLYDPIQNWADEHRARVATISGLLEAMNRRDRRSFSALGGDKVFFSPDPQAIFSAVVAPRAAHLTIDSFAGLRSCKAGRPVSADSDWYTVAWECRAAIDVGASRFSFKFAGRNLVAIQAAPPVPALKLN
jgi:hypothetical protein